MSKGPPPRPALVTRDAARQLPRLALWLLCAAYVVPGLLGRDPWRGHDLAAFAQMLAMAEGRSGWLWPSLAQLPSLAAPLPHGLGAASIALLGPVLDASLAARLPFALLLALTLAAVWYACYHLASTEAAQPLPLAFGGEAAPVDYARAMADGAILALIATLGLLQLGHETTPELAQLAAVACWLWALAASRRTRWAPRLGLVVSLPALAASGAPSIALLLGAGALLLAQLQRASGLAAVRAWLLAAWLLAALVAWPLHSWAWRLSADIRLAGIAQQWLWFLWPSSLLSLWTVWRWRHHWNQRHLSLPLLCVGVTLACSLAMGGSDRALLLALPGISVLAAFALPTLQRRSSAAIDWFSVFVFTTLALLIWLFFIGLHAGGPAWVLQTVQRLTPGYLPPTDAAAAVSTVAATLATAAWIWLVRWRTSRHQPALWKSLVLPAGGVALCWLLLMTLWLPLLDHARSNRELGARLLRLLPPKGCVATPDANPALIGAIEWHARRVTDARPQALRGACPVLVLSLRDNRPLPASLIRRVEAAGWREVARIRRAVDRHEWTVVYRRQPRS